MPSNPFGAQPRPARPPEFGIGYSGLVEEVLPGQAPALVFDLNLREVVPNGYAGLATVHIWVEDVRTLALPPQSPPVNAILVGYLDWQSGRGTGKETIDLTQGRLVSVGGTSHVGLKVQLVSGVAGAPLVADKTKRVEATINWFGHAHAPALTTLPSVTFGANVFSPFQKIPEQARSMLVDTLEPAFLAGLIAEFSTTDSVGGADVIYRVVNPNQNGALVWHGAQFVRFINPANGMTVFAGFQLE